MKRNVLLQLSMLVSLVIILSACGSSKHTVNEPKVKKKEYYSMPCSGIEYQTTQEDFKYTDIGTSTNLSMAKKQAEMNARAGLAASIQAKIQSVTEDYSNRYLTENKEEIMQQIEAMTKQTVDQSLSGSSTICEQYSQEGNKYTYYVCMSLPVNNVLNGINSNIAKDDKMFIEWKKEKFREVFNQSIKEAGND